MSDFRAAINPSVDAVGQSTDQDFEEKKSGVLEFYDIADGKAPKRRDPKVVICMDEFGPLNLLPRPGKQ